MKNVTIGSITLPLIGLSGKEGDAHRQEKFMLPGRKVVTGRSKAESAAKRMNFNKLKG